MMLILIIVLKFVSTEKTVEFGDVIILKIMRAYKCLYSVNELKYETEIWYLEVFYDADFDYATEIRIIRRRHYYDDKEIKRIANILVTK